MILLDTNVLLDVLSTSSTRTERDAGLLARSTPAAVNRWDMRASVASPTIGLMRQP